MMSREMLLTVSNLGSGVVMLSTVPMISVNASRLITHANTSDTAHERKTKMTLRLTLRVDFMSRVGMDIPYFSVKLPKIVQKYNGSRELTGIRGLVYLFKKTNLWSNISNCTCASLSILPARISFDSSLSMCF